MSDPDAAVDRPDRPDRLLLSRHLVQAARARARGRRSKAMLVAAIVLLSFAGLAIGRYAHDRRLGRVELTNDGVPLIAQLFPEVGDEPLGEPFDLLRRSTLTLPDGDYRLRVNGVGRLGRTFRFAVNRGETQSHSVSLDEGLLLGGDPGPQLVGQERPIRRSVPTNAVLELTPGKADLIEWTEETVLRRDGATGRTIWDASRPSPPLRMDEKDAARLENILDYYQQLTLIQPAPDLNGDGTGDLVFTMQNTTPFLALSGRDGSVLWEHVPVLDASSEPQLDGPEGPGPIQPERRQVYLINRPAVADLDRDGSTDLVVTLGFYEYPAETQRRAPPPQAFQGGLGWSPPAFLRRVVQAISGRSGRALWSYPVDATFTMPSNPNSWRPATVVEGQQSRSVAFVDGSRWIRLDPATGRQQGQPIDLGFDPVRPVQYGDLDGDGEPEILALGQAATPATLVAISTRTGQPLWNAPIAVPFQPSIANAQPPDWPLTVDLDGDGRSEIAVPTVGPLPPGDGFRGVQVIDGLTGRTRWIRPMRPETKGGDGLVEILDGPDLDRDGFRDLVVSSFFLGRRVTSSREGTSPVPERVYVDALSGKDGHPLWWWHKETATDGPGVVWPLHRWGRGPDGWPLLAVAIGTSVGPRGATPFNEGPIVYNLEASTGRELHAAVGLTRVGAADLDGDGLADLWGMVDGFLRAFRGEAPEAWRALGWFGAAREAPRSDLGIRDPAADLDGDGIADTLTTNLRAPTPIPNESIGGRALGDYRILGFERRGAPAGGLLGSRTAVARSGRDGHTLWKTELDPHRVWFERDRGETYNLWTSPLPSGDLDGDGAPEVLVHRFAQQNGPVAIRRLATLPLQALSGRTGHPLWSAGPLPLGFDAYGDSIMYWFQAVVVEPTEAPDLIVRHGSPFAPARGTTMAAGSAPRPRLARVSGRDGRILWDLPLSDQPEQNNQAGAPGLGDVDGDGVLDAVLVLGGVPGTMRPDHEVMAVSLGKGRLLWSRRLDYKHNPGAYPQLVVADLDGDRRAEVLVTEHPAAGEGQAFVLQALDGRNGESLWSWTPNPGQDPENPWYATLRIAHFDRGGRGTVCLCLYDAKVARSLVILDARGKPIAGRELPQDVNLFVNFADMNGDGTDELLLSYGERIHALDRDLQELWSSPAKDRQIEKIIPATAGRSGTVWIAPALALDGSDGSPRWTGGPPGSWWGNRIVQALLDPGDDARAPLSLSGGPGATVCRSALATDPRGTYLPPRGAPARPGLARDDPRWIRALPWTDLVNPEDVRTALIATTGLALLNVVIPLGLLRLAARGRWTIRMLMALPVAAAVPLNIFLTLEPLVPALPVPFPVSSRVLFAIATISGIPVVAVAVRFGSSLVFRRWRTSAVLAGLMVLMSTIIASAWLWIDGKSMPVIERYSWSGWYLAAIPGVYSVGILILIGWAINASARLVGRLTRTDRDAASGVPA